MTKPKLIISNTIFIIDYTGSLYLLGGTIDEFGKYSKEIIL